jgi:hypothetical protein
VVALVMASWALALVMVMEAWGLVVAMEMGGDRESPYRRLEALALMAVSMEVMAPALQALAEEAPLQVAALRRIAAVVPLHLRSRENSVHLQGRCSAHPRGKAALLRARGRSLP